VRSTYWCPECQPWVGLGDVPVGDRTRIQQRKNG
jgi:hypothetical protein